MGNLSARNAGKNLLHRVKSISFCLVCFKSQEATANHTMYCLPLADDCGVSERNVLAIMRCLDAGALKGASVMANGAGVALAAAMLGDRLRDNPDIRVGVHLNLFEGRCVAPPHAIPLLADSEGNFRYSLGKLLLSLPLYSPARKTALAAQAALEWRAQVDVLRDLLCAAANQEDVPLYLDGHQHVHAIPALRPALAEVLDTYRFVHVRVPEETRYRCPTPPTLFLAGHLRRELLASWGRSLRRFLRSRGIAAPDFFVGAFASGRLTPEHLEAGLAAISSMTGDGTLVEIMVHPGGAPDMPGTCSFAPFYHAPERIAEETMLLSPRFRKILARHDPSWAQTL